MVEDAYVNHVPVLTGGFGKKALHAFYSHDFIPAMPPDTTLTPVSRTVGDNQLVDEMIFSFTHTQEIPWMLPGPALTWSPCRGSARRYCAIPGRKAAHEHIYWDQASVLKQLGSNGSTAARLWSRNRSQGTRTAVRSKITRQFLGTEISPSGKPIYQEFDCGPVTDKAIKIGELSSTGGGQFATLPFAGRKTNSSSMRTAKCSAITVPNP